MDMNPFANNNSQTQQATPDYLKQDPRANSTMGGAIGNMVKAIMDGNNKFKQQAGATGPGGMPGSAIPGATGPTSFGGPAGPMSLTPSMAPMNGRSGVPPMTPSPPSPTMTSLSANAGNAGPMPTAPSVFDSGAGAVPFAQGVGPLSGGSPSGNWPGMPNGPDRSMQGLFSQIPGMSGGGFFGG